MQLLDLGALLRLEAAGRPPLVRVRRERKSFDTSSAKHVLGMSCSADGVAPHIRPDVAQPGRVEGVIQVVHSVAGDFQAERLHGRLQV